MTTKLETFASLISTSSGSPACYAYERPNGVTDCVVYRLISTVPIKSHNGIIGGKNRFQLTCWGDTLAKSRALADSMKTILDLNKTNFTLSWLTNDFTDKDIESGLFKSYLDFYVF